MENSDYEAIYVEDGVIKKCGNYSEIKNLVCADTDFINLDFLLKHNFDNN